MIKRPMKGAAIDEADFDRLTFPKYASRKIDGFRCVLHQHPLTSRLSRFPNEHFHASLSSLLPRDKILDSEVVVGRRRGPGVLQRTSSGLTSRDGSPDFTLWCFDRPGPGPWLERFLETERLIDQLQHPRIKLLKHRLIRDRHELADYLTESLELEYEGIIIRCPDAPYKEGKATAKQEFMLKVKPFEDAEGIVTGYFEEMENTNEAKREATGKLKRSSAKAGKVAKGRLGGLVLRDVKTKVEVRVGGGFDEEERIGLWPIRESLLGKLVRYKKQKMGEKDKPRHPNFLEFVDFRPVWDFTA